MSENNIEFLTLFTVKITFTTFFCTFYTKINSFIIPDFMKIPGLILYIPEKGF